jgi:hypothetical protein
MSGGMARVCAVASALGAMLFFVAITFGAFSPPARMASERPAIAQGR